ncbi:MaoC family dehydratase [Natronorubrum texcoconense]|uniref:Acyl dehydratase n=1 Tax=Natronorubrum texcoconense TaxID=1095776 RepID=A0A1G9DB38_9EURY|nr:MaoC family dehydratase [Natronorubrum texcoconense]SDK61099.1 Acyl dehydratase [Natronorubrum texcoconense]
MSTNETTIGSVERQPSGPRWGNATQHAVDSYLHANDALFSAFGLSAPRTTDDRIDAPIGGLTYAAPDWSMERSAERVDELDVGSYVRFTKSIPASDLEAFARISGDTNRLHLEESFATHTRFDGRIAHGALVAGTISAALARLPGLAIYLSQNLQFNAPVYPGDTVTAECEIVETLGGGRYRLATTVYDEDGDAVIDGEAVVLVEDRSPVAATTPDL